MKASNPTFTVMHCQSTDSMSNAKLCKLGWQDERRLYSCRQKAEQITANIFYSTFFILATFVITYLFINYSITYCNIRRSAHPKSTFYP